MRATVGIRSVVGWGLLFFAGSSVAYNAGPADTSRVVVQRPTQVSISNAESSPPLTLIRPPEGPTQLIEHEVRLNPHRPPAAPSMEDPVVQRDMPIRNMPVTQFNFLGQGQTKSSNSVTGTPPDTNGAVGSHHFVQVVNGGIAIYDKSTGLIVGQSQFVQTLWTGYVGTNTGNGCAARNDGDPVVVYDQLADRWFITQFSVPSNSGPDWQCVAVSKTSDPTGSYNLYDFQYPGFNDYGKFGIWPDGYYATFNMFGGPAGASDLCAYDRVAMLKGLPATQQCFQQSGNTFGVLPVSLEGSIPPPRGEPGFFLGLDPNGSALDLWTLHLDWTNTNNSQLGGPTVIPVAAFTQACSGGTCIPPPGGNQLDSLADRLMFRLSYRNFGTHESLVVNHSVTAGAGSGVRWYEIRSPNGTPTIHQQGTYAPDSTLYRWMGSIAQDQAEDFALGFSLANSTTQPSVGWTGRLASDPVNTMGQGETVLDTGTASESGASRWGDYSNMTVDPTDDCTFWYTTEAYLTAGQATWDTYIANTKFPSCAANDFSLSASPASQIIGPGGQLTYTVATTSTKGTAEPIVLNIQDLPTGVTGAFNPTSVSAGASSTLTLTAAGTVQPTAATTFTVIGKAPSAVHLGTGQVTIALVPTVSFTSPANASTVRGSVPVAVTATAATGSTLATLALTIDGTPAQSVNASPLNYGWDSTVVPNGPHTLVAKATDADGTSATATLAVTVQNNPTVAITAPANGASVGGSVAITATGSAPNGTNLTTLAITIDGAQVHSGASSPQTFTWDTSALASGSAHTIVATATDADNGTATATVSVTVVSDPTVSITTPADGATVSGSVPVTATATAPSGSTVTSLWISVDGSRSQSGTSSPLTYNWDSTQVANGSHVLRATVTDSAGITVTSSAVTVTTHNAPGSGNGSDGGTLGTIKGSGCGCTGANGAPIGGVVMALLCLTLLQARRRRVGERAP